MDILDKIRTDWKKDKYLYPYPRIAEHQIYSILHKRSSSFVKWIVFISIAEFAFFLLLPFLFLLGDSSGTEKMQVQMPYSVNIIIEILHMGINLFFVYLFFINYRKITNTDNIKNLMANILGIRKIVNRYITIKLIIVFIVTCISLQLIHNNDPQWLTIFHRAHEKGNGLLVQMVYYGIGLVAILSLVTGFGLFYKLMYGILLRQLYKNYQELQKVEI